MRTISKAFQSANCERYKLLRAIATKFPKGTETQSL